MAMSVFGGDTVVTMFETCEALGHYVDIIC
jgi:hypothetical protein